MGYGYYWDEVLGLAMEFWCLGKGRNYNASTLQNWSFKNPSICAFNITWHARDTDLEN